MISIIICSRTATLPSRFIENIENTVGCEYELIVIDNSKQKHSIFEAYNLGIYKSRGTVLCFMHDDILMHTISWGNIAKKLFNKDKSIGLIGIAGTKVKSQMPSTWWECPNHLKILYLIQHTNHKKENWNIGFKEKKEEDVVMIDGVFMLMRKETGIFFNEALKGFHNYDTNICLECLNRGYRIIVTKSILLEHFSLGNIDEKWISSILEFQKLYYKNLPVYSEEVTTEQLNRLEIKNGFSFITKLLAYGYKREALFYWKKLILMKPLSRIHLNIFRTFIKP